jgi:hypothetical protein
MSSCGCCACLAGAGQPVPSFNRPGLSAIRYRAGTHATFFDAMIRRLTVPVRPAPDGYSLHKLTTRETDDASIAMLDAWATSADVLTFYQERIANEAYLRTATERRSMIELGRLVGYTLKPGVAASVHLAYTLEDGAKTIIPAGAKAQSIPGPNEQPQTFETSEEIEARAEWNALRPRMRRPQRMNVDRLVEILNQDGNPVHDLLDNVLDLESVWIEGTNIVLEKREPLLFVFKGDLLTDPEPVFAIRRVLRTALDTERDRTQVFLEKLRPYYRSLFLAALVALQEGRTSAVVRKPIPTPPDPDANGNVPIFADVAEAPKSRKKSKKKKEADPATFAEATPVPAIGDLLREILNGTTRTVLQEQFTGVETQFIGLLAAADNTAAVPAPVPATVGQLLTPLLAERALAPRDSFFKRSLDTALGQRSDARLRLLTSFHPELATTLHAAVVNVGVGNKLYDQFRNLYVLRRQASVFGYNAPDVLFPATDPDNSARPIADPVSENEKLLYLDAVDEKIAVGSRAVIRNARGTRVAEVREVEAVSRSAYGISSRVSRLTIDIPWLESNAQMPADAGKIQKRLDALRWNLAQIRGATVLAQSEELKLAQQPLDRPIGKKRDPLEPEGEESEFRIELDTVVDGLGAGRSVIVRGERLISGTSGVLSAELAMIANVEQQTNVGAGGTTYSILELAPDGLAYEYKRETVEVLANIAPATHGETRAAILGSGSASTPMQTFTLQHTPLTFVSAPTIDGVRSTLAVRIDDALWQETGSLALAGPTDRVYATKTADGGKVTLTFGDGIHGQRIFTGNDNVRAVYRNGIGPDANVSAGQIATAITRTVNMKDVVNPIEASGGAGPESARDARKNIPVSLQAMGRVVSVNDFADFARTFAGISKATARTLAAAGTRFVHLTIGGTNDITILKTSDLYRNLVESLRKYGDPYQPFVVAVRAKIVITGAARVRVHPDHLWSLVAPKVRAALLDAFSYDRREFGQPVFPAEVIAAIQRVPGVDYVDLDELLGVREEDVRPDSASSTTSLSVLQRFSIGIGAPHVVTPRATSVDCDDGRAIIPRFAKVPDPIAGKPGPFPQDSLPAEIAYLPPDLADLFILTEIKND